MHPKCTRGLINNNPLCRYCAEDQCITILSMSKGKMTSYVASHHEYGIDHLANSVPVRKSNIHN